MILITIWQFDVGILYFEKIFSDDIILFLFKLFRLGPTFSVPIVLYVAYTIIKDQPAMLKESSWLNKLSSVLFNKKALITFTIWSGIVYLVNWTSLGIKDLSLLQPVFSYSHYFPVYGSLHWLYIMHMSSFIIFMFLVYLISRKIPQSNFKSFLKSFCIYSLLVIIPGFMNFAPTTGVIASSIGIIIFSITIVHCFIALNTNLKQNYYQVMERQKKLDYTGNLAGSLIHEVKNTNTIISGFSSLLYNSDSLTEKDKSTLKMVQKSSEHLTALTNNYKAYMNASMLSFKKEDLEVIIKNSIDFSSEILRSNRVELTFTNDYQPLHAYVNKTSLEQVFINLIKNSVEAIPADRDNRNITIKTELDDKHIIIHFIDTGKGIPPENFENIFDPFISLENKGMGLGLPYAKKMIIEHLGNIFIVKSSFEGTHFRIELPQNGILNIE
ncbi:sensor histidine kinase [Paraliobacillus ryukyuensis]|nr:HAMP domain-containing sensor histidine kinase [Paraliobacillus ryukyuensis]